MTGRRICALIRGGRVFPSNMLFVRTHSRIYAIHRFTLKQVSVYVFLCTVATALCRPVVFEKATGCVMCNELVMCWPRFRSAIGNPWATSNSEKNTFPMNMLLVLKRICADETNVMPRPGFVDIEYERTILYNRIPFGVTYTGTFTMVVRCADENRMRKRYAAFRSRCIRTMCASRLGQLHQPQTSQPAQTIDRQN